MPAWPPLNSIDRTLQRWCALEPWERRLLIRLLFLLPTAWLALGVFGFKRTRGIVEFELKPAASRTEPFSMARAQRCAQLAAIASRHGVYQANCLHQSLALCWILRRKGLPARLRIGVLSQTQPFKAHAWVELDGIPLGQSVDAYSAFDTLTADPDTTTFV